MSAARYVKRGDDLVLLPEPLKSPHLHHLILAHIALQHSTRQARRQFAGLIVHQ
jgi:hypothetical protein